MAPMKTIQIRKNYNPWVSQETLALMKQRDQLQKISRETGDISDYESNKSLRNKVNNILKYEEKNMQKNKLNNYKAGTKNSWKFIKNILNWHSSGSPSQLFY